MLSRCLRRTTLVCCLPLFTKMCQTPCAGTQTRAFLCQAGPALVPRSAIQVLLADLCKIQQQDLRQGALQRRIEPGRFGGGGDARQGGVEPRQRPSASLPLEPVTLLEVRRRAQGAQ